VPEPIKPQDSVYKRLILFPLALFYMGTLVISTWPQQLMPTGRVAFAVQLAATHALAKLAIRPATNIFTGRTGNDRTATLRTCFKIVGYTRERKARVVFDSMRLCAPGPRKTADDPFERFHNQKLRSALAHFYRRGAPLDRNRPPLNVLFSIGDYYCHHLTADDGEPFQKLQIKSHHRRLHLDTLEVTDRVTHEGAHQCKDGRWDIYRMVSSSVTKPFGGHDGE
jgi:hypothetical protein